MTALKKQLAAVLDQNATLIKQLSEAQAENKLLRQKIDLLVRQKYGARSERLSREQLELMLAGLDAEENTPDDDPPPVPPQPRGRRKRNRKPRLPENLPTETHVINPPEVDQNPSAYICIGEEKLVQLDVIPPQYKRIITLRRKYKKKDDRDQAPVIAPAPNRIIEGGYASPSLLASILVQKYVDHLPLYRQQQILATRHGIHLPRQTMSVWVETVAEQWFVGIYEQIRDDLRCCTYLQIDETPVRYIPEEGGGSRKGYLWVFRAPNGEVLYEWYTSRSADCLEKTLTGFKGEVQCDGYSAYVSYAKREGVDIALSGCWAHVRRKFREAEEAPRRAAWFIQQIRALYAIETRLKKTKAAPVLREAMRSAESRMILRRIKKALENQTGKHHPQSGMGKAIGYAVRHWKKLERFSEDGRLEIDNNGAEQVIRPTALGKKNWLFFGHDAAGQRSAILYTILANCRVLGINPFEYLCDVLTRLPDMTSQQARLLTPAGWLAEKQQAEKKIA
jgi:transposase